MKQGIEQIQKDRLRKLENIKKLNINPYPSKSNPAYSGKDVLNNFKKLLSRKNINVAGRIRGIRGHGGSTFADIDDGAAQLQVYFKQDKIGKKFYQFLLENIDIGDFIEVQGKLFKTRRGEKTILVKSYHFLAKSLAPLPEKWHGLKDLELRFRQRYLDLIMNRDVKDLFIKRTQFIDSLRSYLKSEGFWETETPVLEIVPGGAEAEPFLTHHNTLDIDLYLRISLELHLKRLVIGGFNKVFEIGKVFRNEGMSREHLQEFTLLELYRAYWDYNKMMNFVEKMYKKVVKNVFGRLKFEYNGKKIDFGRKWPKIRYCDAFKKYSGIDIARLRSKDDLIKEIEKQKLGVDIDRAAGKGRIIDQVYKRLVRPRLAGPLFLIDHPIEISPLAKSREDSPDFVERFQILAAGIEIGNGFSELNDPIEQKRRFEDQMKLREQGDKEAHMMDEEFIKAMEYGMPPTAGFGVGIDRLFMILANVSSVRETVLFPIMKPE